MLSGPRLFWLKRVVHATSEPEKMNRARLNENRIAKYRGRLKSTVLKGGDEWMFFF